MCKGLQRNVIPSEGLPVSCGTVEGKARVVINLKDAVNILVEFVWLKMLVVVTTYVC